MPSYRIETTLQGALVLAKRGRPELGDITDIIGQYSTTVRYTACKAIEFGEKKMQNKGYYAAQGHSRSSRSVPIESPYATSY